MSIAERAVTAHRIAQQQLSRQSSAPADAEISRVVGQLAALLGVPPQLVRPDRTRVRRALPLEPLTLHATDPDDPQRRYTFTYLDPQYDDESFFLLAPCPLCAAPVPLAEIRTLADLGAFLAAGTEPLPRDGGAPPDSYPDAFDQHPAHTADCAYRESQPVGLMRRGLDTEAMVLTMEQVERSARAERTERFEVPVEQRFPWITGAKPRTVCAVSG